MYVKNKFGKMFDFDAVVMLMDDEIREIVYASSAPCSAQEFFDAYCVGHKMKFGEPFELAKENPAW